ncbi:hypothetical protein [Anaerocolumna sp.]|uniref:hypothetical protein n=1 Tax=Anaerocolumna sp. TaxID=2041569 RepID=UPI0028A87472|nr:hypothetical protein [Anaerocolumna sp.]
MTHDEYKMIISHCVEDYCNKGGSLLKIALNIYEKEYIFEYDEDYPEDYKKILMEKAYKAMEKGKDLPKGIRLSEVIFERNRKK